MVIGDENLKALIIKRLLNRATKLDECKTARDRIVHQKDALAKAEHDGRRDDVYRHLVNVGTCYGVISEPGEALKYFKRAVEEFPEKRFPLWIVIMTLGHLGEKEEAEKYTKLYEARFPKKKMDE